MTCPFWPFILIIFKIRVLFVHFFGESKRPLAGNLSWAIIKPEIGHSLGRVRNNFFKNFVNFSELKPKFQTKLAGNLSKGETFSELGQNFPELE